MDSDSSKPEITLRPAAPGDSPAIAALISNLGYPTTAAQMAARLERIAGEDAHATFVAVDDGKVLGVVGVCRCPFYESDVTVGLILALSVDPASQGRGVGAALVERAEAWVKAQGAATVVVNSGNERPAAHRFYERQGYVATGLRFKKQF